MKRNWIVDIVVIVALYILFIAWHQNNIMLESHTAFSNTEHYQVYLITTDKGYQYWGQLNQGAEDMAALTGVEYFWEAPDERDTFKQMDLISSAVERGADALIIAADDPKLISGPVEDAKASGVKVIYVDSPAYEEAITTLTTDNYKAGILAGETMIRVLENRNILSGSIGIVNLSEKENTYLREVGFRETLARDGKYRILDTVYTKSDLPEETQEAARNLMIENEDLVALFGTSEGTSIGVGREIGAQDNRYVGIGFDRTPDMVRLLRAGNLNAIIDQNPYTMGYLGMAQAIAAIYGKDTGPEYIDTGVSLVEQ